MNFQYLTRVFVSTLMAIGAARTNAATLKPGDVVVAVQTEGQLYGIDPATGERTLLSEKGLLGNPSHLLIDVAGRVLTAERSVARGVIRIDAATGTQSILASSAVLDHPVALAFDGQRNLIIGNSSTASGQKLFRFNASTGDVVNIATLTGLRNIQDIDVDAEGRIVVLDAGFFNGGDGKIIRFDPAVGIQELVSSGDRLFNPVDLAIDSMGRYVVSNRVSNFSSEFLRVNPTSGSQQLLTTVPSEGFFGLKDDNTVYYATFGPPLSLLEVNLSNGQSRTIASLPVGSVGVAVYQPVPEPSVVTLFGLAIVAVNCGLRRR